MHKPISLHKKSQFCPPPIRAGLTIRMSLPPWLLHQGASGSCSIRYIINLAVLCHCYIMLPKDFIHHHFAEFLAPFLPPPPTCPSDRLAHRWTCRVWLEYRQTCRVSTNGWRAVKMYQGCNFLQGGGKIENLACAHAMGTLSNARGTLFCCHRHLVLSPTLLRRYSIQSFLLPHGSLNQIGRVDSEEANCFCLLLPWDEISW